MNRLPIQSFAAVSCVALSVTAPPHIASGSVLNPLPVVDCPEESALTAFGQSFQNQQAAAFGFHMDSLWGRFRELSNHIADTTESVKGEWIDHLSLADPDAYLPDFSSTEEMNRLCAQVNQLVPVFVEAEEDDVPFDDGWA